MRVNPTRTYPTRLGLPNLSMLARDRIGSASMRVIHSSGTPSARGEAVGVALRSEIEASVSFTMAWAADLGADRRRVEAMLVPYDDATERYAPDLAEVLDGMARGSGVDPVALRATNAFEELYALLDPSAMGAPVERCTDALLTGADGPILVHQEQWYAADADSVAIVVDRPDDGDRGRRSRGRVGAPARRHERDGRLRRRDVAHRDRRATGGAPHDRGSPRPRRP